MENNVANRACGCSYGRLVRMDRVENGKQQPCFVRPVDDQPIYFAALIGYALDEEPKGTDGFVVVTARARTGIVDEKFASSSSAQCV